MSLSALPITPPGSPGVRSVVVAADDLRGVSEHATARSDAEKAVARYGSWSHGLSRRERADVDQPPLTVRADHRLDRWRWLRAGWHERWRDEVQRRIELRCRLELQHLPHPGGVVALRGMPQA